MPWLYNVTRMTVRATAADGSQIGFGPRETIFVRTDQMSSSIYSKINGNELKYKGSGQDLEPLPPRVNEESGTLPLDGNDSQIAPDSGPTGLEPRRRKKRKRL